MKLLKDTVIARKDLVAFMDNLSWASDGSLYMAGGNGIIQMCAKYQKDIETSADLFDIKDYAVTLNNKFEAVCPGTNALIAATAEPKANDVFVSTGKFHALLTNQQNILIFKDDVVYGQVDAPHHTVEGRSYHSATWHDSFLAVGNEIGEILVFHVDEEGGSSLVDSVAVGSGYVSKIVWEEGKIAAVLANNEVYTFACDGVNFGKPEKVHPASRFKVKDVCVFHNRIIVTNMHKVYVYGEKNFEVSVNSAHYIIPRVGTDFVLLLSNTSGLKLNVVSGDISDDELVTPVIERRFKKWNSSANEFKTNETYFEILGLALNHNKTVLALQYTMDKVSIRYTIVSERKFRVAFIPLAEEWSLSKECAGLSCYQEYRFMGKMPQKKDQTQNIDYTLEFLAFLKSVSENGEYTKFENFVEDKSAEIRTNYAKFLDNYVVQNSIVLENPLDIACYESIKQTARGSEENKTSLVFEMKSRYINQTFDIGKQESSELWVSEKGHQWKRCALTFLPILSPHVKFCAVSGNRIIDIAKDQVNEYGWFTKTILEELGTTSIYSGINWV